MVYPPLGRVCSPNMSHAARVPGTNLLHTEHATRRSKSGAIRGTAGQKYFRSTSDIYQRLGQGRIFSPIMTDGKDLSELLSCSRTQPGKFQLFST